MDLLITSKSPLDSPSEKYKESYLMDVKTKFHQCWKYETDEKTGVCLIAKDEMKIKFCFESDGTEFLDVLKINEEIDSMLSNPVSVEGAADHLHGIWPFLTITAMGRAFSHGWITTRVESSVEEGV